MSTATLLEHRRRDLTHARLRADLLVADARAQLLAVFDRIEASMAGADRARYRLRLIVHQDRKATR